MVAAVHAGQHMARRSGLATVTNIETKRPKFAQVPNSIVQDPTLDVYAFRFYMLVLTRDRQGSGCKRSYNELASELGCSRRRTITAAQECVRRGLLHVESNGERVAHTFYALTPPSESDAPASEHDAPDVVHEVPQVVHHVHQPSAPRAHSKEEDDIEDDIERTAPKGAGATAPRTPRKQTKALAGKRPPRQPSPDWVTSLTDALGTAIGWKQVGEKTRTTWRPLLAPLALCTPEQRARFPGWLVSGNGHWKGRGFQLTHSLALECEAFVSAGCPLSKPERSNSRRQAVPDDERPLDDVPQRVVETCYCGHEIGGRRPHGPRCGLSGPITRDNCYQPWREQPGAPP